MKASELRIGNWVFNQYTRKPQQTYPMMIAQIASLEKEGKEVMMQGVKITADWLLSFGFERDLKYSYILKKQLFDRHHFLIYDQNVFQFRMIAMSQGLEETFYLGSRTEPRYIHQLQNLYFALTGEELVIKNNQERDFKNCRLLF